MNSWLAGNHIGLIVESVKEVSSMLTLIAAATQEQSTVAEEKMGEQSVMLKSLANQFNLGN